MRAAATIVIGLVAGIGGSLLVNAVASPSAPAQPAMPPSAQPHQARAAVPLPAITPPGWTTRKPEPEPEPEPETHEPESREQSRLDHYQAELATQISTWAMLPSTSVEDLQSTDGALDIADRAAHPTAKKVKNVIEKATGAADLAPEKYSPPGLVYLSRRKFSQKPGIWLVSCSLT